jgi:hypothetical protein
MKFEHRLSLYTVAFAALTVYFVHSLYAKVEIDKQTDPSAVAILSFVPYLIPIFMAEALAWVVPIAGLTELSIWFFGKNND